MVEHSSANPKVPGSIPGPVSYRVSYEACKMHLTPGVLHNFPKAVVYRIPVPYAQTDPRFLLKKRRGNPGNSGLSSQQ